MNRLKVLLKDVELFDGYNLDEFIDSNHLTYLSDFTDFIRQLTLDEKKGFKYFYGAWKFVQEYNAFEEKENRQFDLKEYNTFISQKTNKAKDIRAYTYENKPITLYFPIHKTVANYNMQQAMINMGISKVTYTEYSYFLGMKVRKVDSNNIVEQMKKNADDYHDGLDVDLDANLKLYGMHII